MRKQIILIRHAESIGNAGKRTTNPAGNHLTENGRAQAALFAGSINEAPDLIVWSSYPRTKETARPLAEKFPNTPAEEWPDIQEFTYLSPKKCFNTTTEERRPMVVSYWNNMDPEYRDGDGAESFADMIKRARKLIKKARERSEHKIMIFTHGQFMEAIRIILKHPDDKFPELMRLFNNNERGKTIRNCETLEIT